LGILYGVLIFVYVLICVFLILVVLLQQGKGADFTGVLGGGAGTQTAFGARGATTLLQKVTVGAFAGFILISLTLSIIQDRPGSSVVPEAPKAGTAPAPAAATPAPQPAVPSTTTAPAPSAPASPPPSTPAQ
jgi:preprotein translocase subunit SecG